MSVTKTRLDVHRKMRLYVCRARQDWMSIVRMRLDVHPKDEAECPSRGRDWMLHEHEGWR